MSIESLTITEEKLLKALMCANSRTRVSRERAANICGGDRQARELIHGLRRKGCPIYSDSNVGGYYYAHSVDEMKPFLAELDSRIKELRAIKKAILAGVNL